MNRTLKQYKDGYFLLLLGVSFVSLPLIIFLGYNTLIWLDIYIVPFIVLNLILVFAKFRIYDSIINSISILNSILLIFYLTLLSLNYLIAKEVETKSYIVELQKLDNKILDLSYFYNKDEFLVNFPWLGIFDIADCKYEETSNNKIVNIKIEFYEGLLGVKFVKRRYCELL
jgi:hypothetical protein